MSTESGQAQTAILTAWEGVEVDEAYGYVMFFYGAARLVPFVTIGPADRVNVGVEKATFRSLTEGVVYDETAVDRFMPHPEYAAQSFVCVRQPEQAMARLRELLREAYEQAARRHRRTQA